MGDIISNVVQYWFGASIILVVLSIPVILVLLMGAWVIERFRKE